MNKNDSSYMKEFGARVKARRKELKLTQKDLSDRINYTVPGISMIENGKRNCNQTEIAKLASALNCDPAYLMGWSEAEESEKNILFKTLSFEMSEMDDSKLERLLRYAVLINKGEL